jgi:hypothetical protein
MAWSLALVALVVLGVAAVSARLEGTPVTPPMVFMLAGLLLGPRVLGEVDPHASGARPRSRWFCSPTPRASTSARCGARPASRSASWPSGCR